MFRALAQAISKPTPTPTPTAAEANAVLGVYPLQLSRWLEEAWQTGGIVSNPGGDWATILGTTIPTKIDASLGDISRLQTPFDLLKTLPSGVDPDPTLPGQQPYHGGKFPGAGLQPPPMWDHLFYAYLVEATGIFEILG